MISSFLKLELNMYKLEFVFNGMKLNSDIPAEESELLEEVDIATSEPYKVVLFNDEVHDFDEVAFQIVKAIKCNSEKAYSLTLEVHSKGKAVVYAGQMSECLRVSSILEEIALHTQIEA